MPISPKGERVGLIVDEFQRIHGEFYALAKVGAVVGIAMNWRLVADELEFILKDSGTTRLIFDNEFVDTVAEAHSRGDKTNIQQWLHVTQMTQHILPRVIVYFATQGDNAEPEFVLRPRHALHRPVHLGHHEPTQRAWYAITSIFKGLLTIGGTAVYHDPERFIWHASPAPRWCDTFGG